MPNNDPLPMPNTAFYRRMAQGHLNRTGHALTGYLRPIGATAPGDAPIYEMVRTCCQEGK